MNLTDQGLVTAICDVLLTDLSGVLDDFTAGRLLNECIPLAADLSLGIPSFQGASAQEKITGFKGGLTDRLSEITRMCAAAASAGFVLPADPSPYFAALNAGRSLFQSVDPPDGLADDTRKLVAAAADWADGTISFERNSLAAQLSGYETSVDGISQQSGDPLADILGYQPDGDLIKRKRAVDALARLDFSKRKPYILFTTDLLRDGRRDGNTVICWQRMRDASGYVIKKRDVFGMRDFPEITISNDTASRTTAELAADDRFASVLSFYDWVSPGDYVAYSDPTSSDTVFMYEVVGIQSVASSTAPLFDVPVSPLHLTAAQLVSVQAFLDAEAKRFGASAGSDSPYPAISSVVFGDPAFGWVLAGCNVLQSVRRGDAETDTRRLMFIGSGIGSVSDAIAAGKFVVPSDLAAFQAAVEQGIAAHGVSQTILAVLDGVGITDYVSGKDDPLGLSSTKAAVDGTTGGLARILSAVDPETATLDPLALLANLSAPMSSVGTYIGAPVQATVGGPSPEDVVGTERIDLTTFDGIGRLVSAIRAIYDFLPRLLG